MDNKLDITVAQIPETLDNLTEATPPALPEAPVQPEKRGFVRRYIYIPLCFAAYLLLDFSFRYFYRFVDGKPLMYFPAMLFTVGWALILTAIAFVLPRIIKRIYMILTIVLYAVLTVVHGVMLNFSGNFMSISSVGFSGDGAAFLEPEYIVLRKAVIVSLVAIVGLMVAAAFLAPREKFRPRTLIIFAAAFAVGVAAILTARAVIVNSSDAEEETAFAWNSYYDANSDSAVYDTFRDQNKCMYMTGLYQYTFRDLHKSLGIFDRMSNADAYAEIEDYARSKSVSPDEMTGTAKGKNLILIQLEAIDSWMMTPEYMPNATALRERSTDFTNYWATVFIQAGTFNSEFITNTGIIPATGKISQKVYTDNTYKYSLANMFAREGYSCNSYHGSEGTVYNRGAIHPNLGYQSYNSGTDMKMPSYQMDSQLIGAYDMFTSDDPFFSFIITFSGHGPYNDESQITKDNIAAARKAVEENVEKYVPFKLTEDELQSYTWAVAHAMETDKFIGELVDKLEADGHIDDTVLVLYADHYNYYLMNDHMQMNMKNAPDVTMLQRVPCFIYNSDVEPQKIDKVVSSLDILPTVANMFALDADLSFFIGNDMYDPDVGGYVVFRNYAWYDGEIYRNSNYAGEVTEYIAQTDDRVYRDSRHCELILQSNYFSTH